MYEVSQTILDREYVCDLIQEVELKLRLLANENEMSRDADNVYC